MTKTSAEPADEPSPFLTQEQLAKRWACCKITIRRRMRAGIIPYIQLGRSVRFELEAIKALEVRSRVNS